MNERVLNEFPASMSGRINIDETENNLNAQFTLHDTHVTVLPITKKAADAMQKFSYNVGEGANHHRWFYGFSDANSAVAFLQTTPMQERFSTGIDMRSGYFQAPLIVSGSSSSITNISSFDKIEFSGGVMDYLYNPRYAINYVDSTIVFKKPKEYTHEYEATINGERIMVTLSIRMGDIWAYEVPDLTKEIKSTLQFKFSESKKLDDIVTYYNYAVRLFQFCTGRLNVRTNISIFNNAVPNKPIHVKLIDGYSDYANDMLLHKQVIELLTLGNGLPKLIELLNDIGKKPYLEFLPTANKYAGKITYTQVMDICVSFENEHKLLGYGRNESLVKEAKEFAKELQKFIRDSDVNNIVKNKACGIIGGNLKNFTPSLKECMFAIFDRYKDEMRLITEHTFNIFDLNDDSSSKMLGQLDREKLGITKFYTDEEFRTKIKDFTKVRGSTAHAGIKWNGGEDIYVHLILLIYYSVLERAGYGEKERSGILSWLFGYRF